MFSRSKDGSRLSGRDLGFALPLALAVLLILSYIVAFTTQRIFTAQVQTRLAVSEINRVTDGTVIENELLWRGLLEGIGRDMDGTRSINDKRYKARAPDDPDLWETNGMPFIWNGNYEALPPAGGNQPPPTLVIAQDKLGLIDLNTADPLFLTFAARQLGMRQGETDAAVRALIAYVASRRPQPEDLDIGMSFPNRSGLVDPVEVCTIRGWRDLELCAQPERLRERATAGYGQIPNIELSPPELVRSMLGQALPDDPVQRSTAWAEVQQAYGFYDGLDVSAGGIRIQITFLIKGDALASRFELDMREQEGEQPFAIRDSRAVPAREVLDLARSRDPEVVSAFERLPAPPVVR